MNEKAEKDAMQETVNLYLDELREIGETNMYGAGIYLQEEFGFDKQEASLRLKYWMRTFSERHPK